MLSTENNERNATKRRNKYFEEKQVKGGIKQGFFKIQDVKDPILLEEYL